jgi:hypothetical protein
MNHDIYNINKLFLFYLFIKIRHNIYRVISLLNELNYELKFKIEWYYFSNGVLITC